LERQVGGERAGVQITLAQALVTSKKMDFIVQKGTELGIAAFVPVISSRSIIKLENRTAQKVERWRKVAREASKQCRNVHPPEIWLPQPFQTVLCRREERKLFLSENNGEFLKDILLRNSEWGGGKRPASVLVLTGPEGGWTKKEEEEIIDHGFEAVSLGKYILRAETASFCAVALIAHFWDA
jgi:16S rRNA (uracil1498-N3)-methyltransferase